MNSQFIKKHAVEAGAFLRPGYVEQPNGDSVWQEGVLLDHTDIDLRKFAELIVKECAEKIAHNERFNWLDSAQAAKDLLHSFGVK